MPAQPAASRAARTATRRGIIAECPCCGRRARLTFHHLIPRKVHRRKRFRNGYSRGQLARGLYVCRLCHDGIHQRFDELTLALHYREPQLLLTAPELQSHFRWAARQREDFDS